MKRFYIGIGLLALLLAVSLLTTRGMQNCHEPISADLEEAAACAMTEDWAGARSLSRKAQQEWERCRNITAVFADHTPMEEIDSTFAQMEVFAAGENAELFASTCASLSRQVEAMGEAHGLMWWNLL